MKRNNNRGITMISLTVYVVIIGIVIAILAAFKGNIDESLDSMSEYTSAVPEFNKMHMYMLDELNIENNKVVKRNADGSYIEFSSGNTYIFSDNKIFKNNVKIFSDVESCSFELAKENDNDILFVNLSVNETTPVSKELKYVVNNTILVMDDPYSKIGITLNPSQVTSDNVQVTFTNQTGDDDLTLKYQIGSTSGQWLEYNTPIEMSENGTIYAVLANERDYFASADIVKAVVDNIDKELPNVFEMDVTAASNSITVTGNTTDKGTVGASAANIGISGYQFILYDENGNVITDWTDKQSGGSYTFTGLTAQKTYKVSMRAIDKAGNVREASNKNFSVTTIELADSSTAIGIVYSTEEPTNGIVTVEFVNNSTDPNLTLRYQLDTTEGAWTNYIEPIEMGYNGYIYARLFTPTGKYNNTAQAVVDNIDAQRPAVFEFDYSATTNSITVVGSTEDVGSDGTAEEHMGLVGYQFRLKDVDGNLITDWTELQDSGTYTFTENLKQGVAYKPSMRAVDKAGNIREASNKDFTISLGNVADVTKKVGIEYSDTSPTQNDVIVTLTDNSGDDNFTLKYQIDTTEGEWLVYENPIVMDANGIVNIRLYDSTDQYNNTLVAQVANIDREKPNEFDMNVTSTTNSITVTGSTTDNGSTGTAAEHINIRGYQYKLDDGEWTAETTETTYTFTNLTAGINHTVSMRAIDLAGNIRDASNNDYAIVTDMFDSEVNIGITYSEEEATQNAVTVYFDNNSGDDSLVIKYQIGSTTGTWLEYSESGVSVSTNTKVYARLYSVDDKYKNTAEAEVTNIDTEKPNEFDLSVTSTTNSITVSGSTTDKGSTGTADEYIGIRGYQYKLDDGEWTAETTETTYTFEGLDPEITYKVSMKAIDLAGNERDASNNDYSIETLPLVKVSSFEVTSVEWNSVTCNITTNDKVMKQYDVYINGSKKETFTTTSSDYEFTISGLDPETDYSIYVIATDIDNNTATSETKTFTTSAEPLQVLSFEITNIEWDRVTCNIKTNDKVMKQYEVYINGSKKETFTTTSADYDFTVSGLSQDTDYSMYVVATDNDNATVTSETKTFTTDENPLEINSFEVTSVEWNSVTGNIITNDKTIKQYDIYINGSKKETFTTTSTNYTFTISDLNASTSYTIYVKATDTDGYTATSETKSFTTSAYPLAITSFEVTDVVWNSISCNVKVDGSDIKQYDVYINGSKNKTFTTTSTDYNFTISDLDPETSYNIYVIVTDNNNSTAKSETKSVTTDEILKINSIEITDIEWDRFTCTVTTNDKVLEKYEIYINGTLFGSSTTSNTTCSFLVQSLNELTSYSVYVIATDSEGLTATSETKQVTTIAGVDNLAPTALTFEPIDVGYREFTVYVSIQDQSDTNFISGLKQLDIYVLGNLMDSVSISLTYPEQIYNYKLKLTGATHNSTYPSYIVVTDNKGNTYTSDVLNITTLEGTDNLPPTDIELSSVNLTDTSFDFVINARDVSDTDYVSGIAKYEIYQISGDEHYYLGARETSDENITISITGGSSGYTYTFYVIITDAAGNSVTSETITITMLGEIATDTMPPTNVNLTYSDLTSESVKLICTAKDVSESDYISGIYSYEIIGNGTSLTTRISGSETFEITVSGLTPTYTYTFKMNVSDSAGNTTTSNTVTVTIPVADGTLLVELAEPGDKVEYTGNGYSDWTVISNDGTYVTIVSDDVTESYTMDKCGIVEGVSTTSALNSAFSALTQNLNNVTSKYKNSYALSSRIVGTKADGTPDNVSEYDFSGTIIVGGYVKVPDDVYTLNSLGLLTASTKYWLGSQYPVGIMTLNGVTGMAYNFMDISKDGAFYEDGTTIASSYYCTYGIRPIIKLKAAVETTGKNSSGAWKITM